MFIDHREPWSFTTKSTTLELGKALRAARARLEGEPERTPVSIAILSNFSTQYLSQAILTSLVNNGLNPQICETSFDQWELELNNKESHTHSQSADFLILTLSSTRLIQDPRVSSDPSGFVNYLRNLIVQLQNHHNCEIILTLPENLHAGYDHTSFFYKVVSQLRSDLTQELRELVHLVDLNPLIMEFGFERWEPGKYLANGQFSCHPNCYPLFGSYLANFIRNLVSRSTKLVITDLDNTLWSGVLGDLGWREIGLERDGSGYPHLALQRYLRDLKQSGVLLALASKNHENYVREAFENRREMILNWSDFAAIRINWNPKSQNIKEILTELNLSASGVVFLDDSKFEREEVRSSISGVIVPELPEDISSWCSFLSRSGLFTIGRTGAEDVMRLAFYEGERKRRNEAALYSSYDDFLKDLKLEVTVNRIDDSNFERVFELIQKTNQFNLTTKRLSRTELLNLTARDDCTCLCYQLSDKFSDYGIIAVLIAERKICSQELNTLLMSCRVMGRGVEMFIFDHFVQNYLSTDEVILGEYTPTQKNQPAADLLEKLGFEPIPESTEWHFKKGCNQNPSASHINNVIKDS